MNYLTHLATFPRSAPLVRRADRYAVALGRAVESGHVNVEIRTRRWWHELSLQTAWQREWLRSLRV